MVPTLKGNNHSGPSCRARVLGSGFSINTHAHKAFGTLFNPLVISNTSDFTTIVMYSVTVVPTLTGNNHSGPIVVVRV